MQSTARLLPSKVLRRAIKNNTLKPVTTPNHPLNYTTRRMAMFGPRFYTQAEPNFSGLFRLIDEFDDYASSQQNEVGRHNQHRPQHARRASRYQQQQQQQLQIPTFTPRFDLKETETDFELHGELPGLEKDQVNIEFTDPQTITIRGRVERSYTAGTPPAGLLDDKMSGALAEGGEAAGSERSSERRSSFNATVEDDAEEASTTTGTAVPTPASTSAELAKSAAPAEQQQKQQPEQPKHKYWISERSIGEFSRSFSFPGRVDHDNVRASLNNGILTVTVPKAKKQESRRIAIN